MIPMPREPEDKPCKKCGRLMHGINDYRLRYHCEPCGGNRTKFHVGNPHPEKNRKPG